MTKVNHSLEGNRLSEEPIKRILKDFGLTEKESDVYIFLAKHGTLKRIEIAKQTRIDRAEVYRIVQSLQSKGFLEATLEAPARFVAVSFEKVIDSFIKERRDEASLVEKAKSSLLSDWQKIHKTNLERSAEKFLVVEGESKIYPKIFELIRDTKNHLSIISTVQSLLRADQSGLFDAFMKHPLRAKIQFRFITELSEENVSSMKSILRKVPPTGLNIGVRTPDLGLRLSPRMIVRDNEEVMLFINSEKVNVSSNSGEENCLLTNCKAIVQSYANVFADLWENSTEIEKKILEVETGKPITTHVIWDAETVMRKYSELLAGATEEVVILTSSEGLAELSKASSMLKGWAEKGVSVKVMSPIVNDNLAVSEFLSRFCKVKHIPENRLSTTLVDGQHLFQFENPKSRESKKQATSFIESAVYTNRYEQVQKAKTILYSIWKKARRPSTVTSDDTLGHSNSESLTLTKSLEVPRNVYMNSIGTSKDWEEGTVTEKDIINKMVKAKRILAKDPMKDINTLYGSSGNAILHLPSYFNLPDMTIAAVHGNKQSSFGAEDTLVISLWLETPKGYAFVPVAHVTDNQKAAKWREGVYAGTPAGQNSILVKKNQLKVTVQGNTLFAIWTVSIPLVPPKYILPPASILFETYGEPKSCVHRTSMPSGRTQLHEFNRFKAFATFFHPTSKYSGPGTDGYLDREILMTAYPPELNKH